MERYIRISSELSNLSYDWLNVKVMVVTTPFPGITIGEVEVIVVLGPALLPVQTGVVVVEVVKVTLCRIRLLSLPT